MEVIKYIILFRRSSDFKLRLLGGHFLQFGGILPMSQVKKNKHFDKNDDIYK